MSRVLLGPPLTGISRPAPSSVRGGLVQVVDELVPEPHAGVDQDRPVRVTDEEAVHGDGTAELGGRMRLGQLHHGEFEVDDLRQLVESQAFKPPGLSPATLPEHSGRSDATRLPRGTACC